MVEVFELSETAGAQRCYAWRSSGRRGEAVVMLKSGTIATAEDAVQSWLHRTHAVCDSAQARAA